MLGGGCRSRPPAPTELEAAAPPPVEAPSSRGGAPPAPESPFAAWLRARLPPGGEIEARDAGALTVYHTVRDGETAQTLAKAYLDLTTVYRASDLASEIGGSRAIAPGLRFEVPHLLKAPYGSPDEERLRWPSPPALKGVFISGIFAGAFWPETLNKLAARGLNAVVLDAKDYMGPVNYPTRVALAQEIGASKGAPIPDLFRAIRFAHARGIHVIVRIPCFHDPWAAKQAPRLSLMNRNGHVFSMGWLDPANVEAQNYLRDLVQEAVDLGADEVQLDYVRFPVQPSGVKYAVMPAPDGHRSLVMRDFVRRVHQVTQAARVPLSLDLFGVTATGEPSDIEALGQNIGVVGAECEAISPMVYPSHYASGWHGFAEPGEHPEIIGIGTRAALDKLHAARIGGTVVRPWLQASSFKTKSYGPAYVRNEIRSAETSGAVGWLLWDPDNSYWALWQALPASVPLEARSP